MTVELPKLPDRALLADLCRETAARERVQPQLVEKDFYLTRLLWALGQSFGDELVLKGGALLSKVDLGFFRMSEDADLVLPGPASRQRLTNVRRMHRVRDVLKEIGPLAKCASEMRRPRGARNPSNLAALHWSGRQDLNLRPPGPELGPICRKENRILRRATGVKRRRMCTPM